MEKKQSSCARFELLENFARFELLEQNLESQAGEAVKVEKADQEAGSEIFAD